MHAEIVTKMPTVKETSVSVTMVIKEMEEYV